MGDINQLLANPYIPNIVGQVQQGKQFAQSNAQAGRQANLTDLQGQALQQKAQQQGQVNQLLSNKNLTPTQRTEELSKVSLAAAKEYQGIYASQNEQGKKNLDATVKAANSLVGDLDPADPNIQAKLQSGVKLGYYPADVVPKLLELGPQGIKSLSSSTDKTATSKQVQSSEFLPGGGVRVIRKDGTVEVIQPTEQESAVIKSAEDRGVDLQQQRAQGRKLGTDAAETANKAFEQTGKMRANIITLRKVISEVKGGAETGPLAARMPSFRAESVRLDTLRNQLGLDVVGSVTFGALSEGELNLALSTALPTGLEGPELVKWAEDKISAQEKLSSYLEDQAIFLSKRGNTAADWLTKTREGKPEQGQKVGRFTVEVQ